jgi:Apea-like HEPN
MPPYRPIDPQFFELFSEAVNTALKYARLSEQGKTYIASHRSFDLLYHENGLPWITSSEFGGPKDYSSVINSGLLSSMIGGEQPPIFSEEQAFLALVKYARINSRLSSYLVDAQGKHELLEIFLQSFVGRTLDRYVHVSNTTKDLNLDHLLPIYAAIERHLFSQTLSISAVIPILFLKFEPQRLEVSDILSLEKLSDDFHITRAWRDRWSSEDNSLVEGSATHGLFVKGLAINNERYLETGRTRMDPDFYPVELIDQFFAAIRAATGYATGYAQIIAVPHGWSHSFRAKTILLDGPQLSKYPPAFERGYWNQEVPTVTNGQAQAIKDLCNGMERICAGQNANKMRLAVHRLNLSALRTTDEDGIVDAMIAFEALLGSGNQEMTHKVATRLAALYKISDPPRASEAFREMKKLYEFRSKVVHGGTDLEKYRQIKRGDQNFPAVEVALEHLRTAFRVLTNNPGLLQPETIDLFLLTGHF